jgi:hypothetical protein
MDLPGAAPDALEVNNTRQAPTQLGKIVGTGQRTGLNLHRATDEDWFRFETVGVGTALDVFDVKPPGQTSVTALTLELYDAAGVKLVTGTATANGRQVSLNQRPAGVYYVRVNSATDQTGLAYELTWRVPSPVADAFEPSEDLGSANDFGLVLGAKQVNGLTLHTLGDEDWYRFEVADGATVANQVSARFTDADGDVELALFDATGRMDLMVRWLRVIAWSSMRR